MMKTMNKKGMNLTITSLVLALMLLVWSIASPVGAKPGRPPAPGGQGSIAVMLVGFDLNHLLETGEISGTFAVANKDPVKNPDIIVSEFAIRVEERVHREWRVIDLDPSVPCTFVPASLPLSDADFHTVDFTCALDPSLSISPNATSVRVTAFVSLDGRIFLGRLSKKL